MGVLCELNFSTRSGKSGVMANETELIDAQDSYLIMVMEASCWLILSTNACPVRHHPKMSDGSLSFFTFCRFDLVVIVNGRKEKIASGLLNPFLAHLKVAQDQIAKGGYSITLEPSSGVGAPWFTRGTVERLVAFCYDNYLWHWHFQSGYSHATSLQIRALREYSGGAWASDDDRIRDLAARGRHLYSEQR